jgi:VanZ family protein
MLPGREADIQDLIANTIGILAATWVARQLMSKDPP